LRSPRRLHDDHGDGLAVAMRECWQLRLLGKREHVRVLVDFGGEVDRRRVGANRGTLEGAAPVVAPPIAVDGSKAPVIDDGHGSGRLGRRGRDARHDQKQEGNGDKPGRRDPYDTPPP
jgi:hypothetical protein